MRINKAFRGQGQLRAQSAALLHPNEATWRPYSRQELTSGQHHQGAPLSHSYNPIPQEAALPSSCCDDSEAKGCFISPRGMIYPLKPLKMPANVGSGEEHGEIYWGEHLSYGLHFCIKKGGFGGP